ncbi:ABC transporter permease [Tahibacter harae]|uniref:ABC transporter permease n=1 Tax=Tahibacter harae TaxID=2963937 RepID=A0ABT1QT58_9GAMM|nr:ABC transporter permease [Tahibacter harae]MCQ4165459.1 ABC transporter permease [Tahibacter harae]
MSSNRIIPVIKREVRVKLGLRFIVATIFIPMVMAAIVGIQFVLTNMKSQDKAEVTLVLEQNPAVEGLIKQSLEQADFMKSGLYTVNYEQLAGDKFQEYLNSKTPELLKDDNKSIIYVPASALTDKKIGFYSANVANADVRTKFGGIVSKALNLNYFAQNNIQNVDIGYIQTDIFIIGNKVSASGTRTESWGPIIIGGVLALLLNLGITFNAMPLMNVVVGEKANRLYEVLLTSLRPTDILWGKIIGTAIVATLQMLIWVATFVFFVFIMDTFSEQSVAFRMDFQPFVIGYYLVNYVVGILIFLTLYAGLSSMYDNQGAASTALTPLYFLLLLPMYTVFSLVSNPANTVAAILSITPFTSLYVMPARMSLIDVPVWQPLLALALNLAVLYFANYVSSKIYRVSVLATGNNPSLRQIFTWVKNH